MTRRGFTLVEVIVALALTGTVLLVGGRAFAVTLDGLATAERASAEALWQANRRSWLERTVRSLEVGTAPETGFDGEPGRVRFSARVRSEFGWWERRRVELALRNGQLVALTDGGEPVLLAASLADAGFDYLIQPGLDSRWTRRWQSPVSAPLAIRVRTVPRDSTLPADTLLLYIGERG